MKKLTNSFLLCALLMITIVNVNAQIGVPTLFKPSPERANEAAKRKLIVVQEVEHEETVKKLTKNNPKELEIYKKDLEEYNNLLKENVEKYWDFNESITYKTLDEVKDMAKKGNKSYMVLLGVSLNSTWGIRVKRMKWANRSEDQEKNRSHWFGTITQMCLYEIERIEGDNPIVQQPLVNIWPEKMDFVYSLQVMQTYLKTRQQNMKYKDYNAELAENAKILPTKTLLLRKDWLDKRLTEAEIKENYEYKYKVVDKETFNERIIEGDTSIAYAIVTPVLTSKGVAYIHYVVKGGDGTILGVATLNLFTASMLGGGLLGSAIASETGKVIKAGDLKEFTRPLRKKK